MLFWWFAYEPRLEFCEPDPSPTTLPDTITGYLWGMSKLFLLLAALQRYGCTRLPGNNIPFSFATSHHANPENWGLGNTDDSLVGTGLAFLFKDS